MPRTHTIVLRDVDREGSNVVLPIQMTMRQRRSGESLHTDLYRQLFTQAPAIIVLLRGPSHVCEFVNDAYLRLLGPRDIIGKPLRETWPELESQGFLDLLDRVYATGTPYGASEVFARLDPSGEGNFVEGYYNFVYQPTRNAAGEVEGVLVHAVDVTELVKARQDAERLTRALQDEKAWLRGVLAGIADAVIATDTQGRVSLMNPVAEALTGWPQDEARGHPLAQVFHVVHEHTRHPMESPADQIRREAGLVRRFDHSLLLRRDGTEVVVEQSFAPVPSGIAPQATVLVFRDITERKRAERAALQREEHFRALLESTTEGIWGLDADGFCTFANPACVNLLGFESAAQLLGKNMDAVVHDHGDAHAPRLETCGLDEALRTGASTVVDGEVFRRRDGTAFPVQYRSSPLLRDEHVDGAVVAFEDITERKGAAERLRQLTRILEESTDFIAMARVDSTGFFVNPAGRKLVGRDLEEQVESMRIADYMAPDSVPEAKRIIAEALEKGQAAGEIRLRHAKTGEEIPTWWPVFVIRDDETKAPLFWATVARDLREQKRAEAERAALVTGLRERAAFEQQLIGIVSHDLRNPLNAMLLGTRALLRREDLDDRTMKAAVMIQSAGDRAVRLVKDLLDFTQARLGRGLPVNRARMDLHGLVQQVAEEVKANSPERTLEVLAQGDCEGEWDRDRLSQVVANLAANAMQYSHHGTPVRLTTRGLDGAVELEVHNQGPAIPKDDLGRLFEPMQRASSQGTTATRSVGLGLYIVKHIVDAHGGTIDVQSSPASGTAFTVRLPR